MLAAEDRVDLPKPTSSKLEKLLEDAAFYASSLNAWRAQPMTLALVNVLVDEWKGRVRNGDDVQVEYNLRGSLTQYVGRLIDARFCRVLSLQMASRAGELDEGILQAYTRPVQPEWVYAEIDQITATADGNCMVRFEALTGHPAGNLVTMVVSQGFLRFLAYQLGFSRKMQYEEEPRLLIGLRFQAYLVPKVGSTEPKALGWNMEKQLKQHNVPIIKLRSRFTNTLPERSQLECPHLFEHDCWECSKSPGECPGSCRRS